MGSKASEHGHAEVLRLLLEADANKNLANGNGDTAIKLASQEGHLELVRLLLDAGADKNSANNNGYTALMAASDGGHIEVVRMLLAAGADSSHAARCRCRQERGRPQRLYGLDGSFCLGPR